MLKEKTMRVFDSFYRVPGGGLSFVYRQPLPSGERAGQALAGAGTR